MVGQDVPFVLYVGLHDIPAALEDATFLKHSQQQSRRFSAVHGRLAPDYFMGWGRAAARLLVLLNQLLIGSVIRADINAAVEAVPPGSGSSNDQTSVEMGKARLPEEMSLNSLLN